MPHTTLFDLYLRTGFSNMSHSRGGDWVSDFAGIAEINRYPIEEPFTSVARRIEAGKAPYILFVDEGVILPDTVVTTFQRVFGRAGNLPALTFTCEAMVKVFGGFYEEPRVDLLRRSLFKFDWLPPWFCALNRDLLVQSRLLQGDYRTLEFFLLELRLLLREKNISAYRLNEIIDLDTCNWVRDLFDRGVGHLSEDYSRFLEVHTEEGKEDVPSQFRVELLGEYVNPGKVAWDRLPADTKQPKFTVICPVFKPVFLEEMLDSIIGQSYRNWELRILVDGPPEEDQRAIRKILDTYAHDDRVNFEFQENMGTGWTRSRLAGMAGGEFVITIDDDDMFFPDTLEIFAAAIDQNTGVPFFRGGAHLVGVINQYLYPRARIIVDGISADTFEVTQPFAIKRTVLEQLGGFEGDETIKGAGEDTDLFLKIDSIKLPTIIINRPMYYRRLSTFNQSLSFVVEDAFGHLGTIDARHTPPGWIIAERTDLEEGRYTCSILTYTNIFTGQQVVAPTKFFSYQTVGELHDKSIDLEITTACNANCRFCPRDELSCPGRFMPLDMVHLLAGQIRQGEAARKVVLCGIGESTLHPQLEEIVTILTEAGAYVCMTTNGTGMNGERFANLARLGMKEFNFSLNAFTPGTHQQAMNLQNFDKVVEVIHQILDVHHSKFPYVKIHVSFVLCNLNRHEVNDFIEYWKKTGVHVWVHPTNNRAGLLSQMVEPGDFLPLEEQYRDDDNVTIDLFKPSEENGNVCRITLGMDFISVDGCMRLCALDYQRNYFFGHLADASLKEMHRDKVLCYLREETRDLCAECNFYQKPGALSHPAEPNAARGEFQS